MRIVKALKRRNQSQQVPQRVQRQINPKFKDRLPAIIEDIWRSMLIIEPEVQKMMVPLKEFLDHLDFEIQKIDLMISRQEWDDRVDPEKLKADKEWRQKLIQLREDFSVDRMADTVPFARDMLRRVQEAFGEVTRVTQTLAD
jgi:hypothetical protein